MAEQASERFGVRAVSAEQLESKVLQQVRGCLGTASCVSRILRYSLRVSVDCEVLVLTYLCPVQAQVQGAATEDLSEGERWRSTQTLRLLQPKPVDVTQNSVLQLKPIYRSSRSA